MTVRRRLPVLFLGVLLIFTGASACPASDGSSIEVEDCDAEDRRNKEAECGFTDADRQKLKTPAPAKTPGKPAERPVKPAAPAKPPKKP